MIVLGIDPGMAGAIALYAGGRLVEVADMPLAGREVDPYQIARILERMCAAEGCDMVLVEQQQAMPKQGVSTTFKIGNNFGLIRGVVAALGYRITTVRPGVWKRRLSVPSDKDAARLRASQLIPEGAATWPLKKHDGRAEAALLAYYGATQVMGADAPDTAPGQPGPAGDLLSGLEAA